MLLSHPAKRCFIQNLKEDRWRQTPISKELKLSWRAALEVCEVKQKGQINRGLRIQTVEVNQRRR